MRRLHYLFIIFFIAAFYSVSAYAEEPRMVTSTELICGANTLDGQIVTYKGEIVAAIMNRGEHSWINLNDGYSALGVWCRAVDLAGVKTVGDYKHEGDVLEITGVFHRACPAHGGELDIHADTVRIEFEGFRLNERLSKGRVRLAAVFFTLTIIAVIIFRKRI